MEPGGISLCPKGPASGSHPFNSHLHFGLPAKLRAVGFPTECMHQPVCMLHFQPMLPFLTICRKPSCVINMKASELSLNQECAKHLTESSVCMQLRLNFVTVIIFDEEYANIVNSVLLFFRIQIFYSARCSQARCCSFVNVRDQVSHIHTKRACCNLKVSGSVRGKIF
jgi:hypothetical protein